MDLGRTQEFLWAARVKMFRGVKNTENPRVHAPARCFLPRTLAAGHWFTTDPEVVDAAEVARLDGLHAQDGEDLNSLSGLNGMAEIRANKVGGSWNRLMSPV